MIRPLPLTGHTGLLDGKETLRPADTAVAATGRAGGRLGFQAPAPLPLQTSHVIEFGTRICAFLPEKASSSSIVRS